MKTNKITRSWFLGLLLPLLALSGCISQGLPEVIYLARHGQTEWNRVSRFQGDPDLDQVGYINRVNLWMLLKDEPISAVYASERLRTQRTAALVARQHGLEVQVRGGLNEIEAGIGEGICYSVLSPRDHNEAAKACMVEARGATPGPAMKVLAEAWKRAREDRLKGKLPLGENYDDMMERSRPVVDELRQSRGTAARKILVVGHGVINRVLLHQLLGWPLKNLAHVHQENDHVYRIEAAGQGKKARLFLFAPGRGWRRCKKPPKQGDKHLDCSPRHGKKDDAPAQKAPAIKAAPAQPPEPVAPVTQQVPAAPVKPEGAQPMAPTPAPAPAPAQPETPPSSGE